MKPIIVQVGVVLVIGVILDQRLAASDGIKTGAIKTSAPKRPAEAKEAQGEPLKLASGRLAPQKSTSKSAPRKAATKKTKFQSRVMRSANPIETLGDAPLGLDAWSQHSLLPTFVDQEQGDEMVALASDPGESVQQQREKVAPRHEGASNLSDSSYMKRYQADRLQREQAEDERFLAREHQERNKLRSSSLVADDYYADDDDDNSNNNNNNSDSDNDQEHGAQLVKIDQKQTGLAQVEPARGAGEQKVANFQPIEQSSGVKAIEIKNLTSEQLINLQRSAGGWLPTGLSQIKQQSQPDQRQSAFGRGEKVATFFGGRGESPKIGDSLSKTDMAIEYLRSILKTKQNRLQLSQSGTNSSQQSQSEETPKLDKGLKSYYPLPVQLREFARPVNRTAASDQVKLTASGGGDLQEVADRFSISDVKQRSNQEFASTAVPFVPINSSLPAVQNPSPKQTTGETNSTAKTSLSTSQAALEFATMGPAGGAPLGGDYNDDIPRGLRMIASQQQSQAPAISVPAKGIQHKAALESMATLASDQLPAVAASQHEDKFLFRPHQTFGSPPHSSIYFNMRPPGEARSTQVEFKREEFQQQVPNVAPDFTKSANQSPVGTQQNFEFDRANLDEGLFKPEQQIEQTPLQEVRVQKPIELGAAKSFVGQNRAPIEQVVESEPKLMGESANLERAQVKVFPALEPAHAQMISSKLYRIEQPPRFAQLHHQESIQHSSPHQHDNHLQRQYQAHSQHDHSHQESAREYGAAHQPVQQQAHRAPQRQPYQQHYSAPPVQPRPSGYQAPGYQHEQAHPAHAKAPRIVSYNYFESNEHSLPTNFQLGDSLLSSTGDVEHTLSNSELDAIQSQFMTAEHPVVPMGGEPARQHKAQKHREGAHSHELSNLLEGLRPSLGEPTADPLKEQASEEQARLSEPKQAEKQPERQLGEPKRKSLVVYLNHPRGDEVSRSAAATGESLAQLISEQTSGDPFVSAREFDSHGLARDSTRLDVASLQGSGGPLPKEALGDKDKEGLSVVVIGDAYKYKKIVLLISAKTGGLKFVPMVKDMKR